MFEEHTSKAEAPGSRMPRLLVSRCRVDIRKNEALCRVLSL